jgi:hypothetical protein
MNGVTTAAGPTALVTSYGRAARCSSLRRLFADRKGVVDVSKAHIRRWWFAGFWVEVFAVAASLLVPRLTQPGRVLHGHEWRAFTVLLVCLLVALTGVALQVVAWVAAMRSAKRARDDVRHRRLLRTGILGALLTPLLGLGAFICWAVMLDYLRQPRPSSRIRHEPASIGDQRGGVVRKERV